MVAYYTSMGLFSKSKTVEWEPDSSFILGILANVSQYIIFAQPNARAKVILDPLIDFEEVES